MFFFNKMSKEKNSHFFIIIRFNINVLNITFSILNFIIEAL